jgi:hypothetical protein
MKSRKLSRCPSEPPHRALPKSRNSMIIFSERAARDATASLDLRQHYIGETPARERPVPVIQSSRANTIEIGSFAAASTRRSAGRASFHRVRPAFGNAQPADLPPSAPFPIRAKLSTGSPWRPDGSSARTKFSDGQEVGMAYERLDEALRQLKTDSEPSPCSHRAPGSDLWRRSSGHAVA